MLHSKKRFPPSMFEMDGNARRHKARVKKRERKRGPEREGERKGEGEKRKKSQPPVELTEKHTGIPWNADIPHVPLGSWNKR